MFSVCVLSEVICLGGAKEMVCLRVEMGNNRGLVCTRRIARRVVMVYGG